MRVLNLNPNWNSQRGGDAGSEGRHGDLARHVPQPLLCSRMPVSLPMGYCSRPCLLCNTRLSSFTCSPSLLSPPLLPDLILAGA